MEEMTKSQFENALITIASAALNIPRIAITLINEKSVIKVVVHKVHSWIEETDPDYDAKFDHLSEEGKAKTPCHDGTQYPCLVCGDITIDIDAVDDQPRETLCKRCRPCAVCDDCRVTISDEPVCFSCIQIEHGEYQMLAPDQRKRYDVMRQQSSSQDDQEEVEQIKSINIPIAWVHQLALSISRAIDSGATGFLSEVSITDNFGGAYYDNRLRLRRCRPRQAGDAQTQQIREMLDMCLL